MNKPVNEAYVERGSRGGRGAVEKGKVGRKSQSVKGKGKQGRKKNQKKKKKKQKRCGEMEGSWRRERKE